LTSGGTPSKQRTDYWGGMIPWVSAKDLKSNYIFDSELHITEAGAANGTRLVPENTVLCVVRGMSLAKEFRVSLAKVPVTFTPFLRSGIKFDNGQARPPMGRRNWSLMF
jgi:type I restriction enzyme S subunit